MSHEYRIQPNYDTFTLHSENVTTSSTPESQLPICMVQLNEWQLPYSELK